MENFTEENNQNRQENNDAAAVLYDKNARQTMGFVKKSDEGRYELDFAVSCLSDEDLIEFDRLAYVKVENEEDEQIMRSDDLDACSWFFEKNVLLVGGYEGEELPEDWLEYFGKLDRQKIFREFLEATIKSAENSQFVKKLSFARAVNRRFVIESAFNGTVVNCFHTVPSKAENYLNQYIEITTGLVSRKDETGSFLPQTVEKLGELYGKIGITSEGYVPDGIPINHKAMVLRSFFQTETDKQRKKLKT